LGDFQSKHNKISLYKVADETEAERVATALACTRMKIQDIGYLVVPMTEFEGLELIRSDVPGETPDEHVNSLHFDVERLCIENVGRLVNLYWKQPRIPRMTAREVERRIRVGLEAGNIDQNTMGAEFRKHLIEKGIL
jgi:hypothetical protein